jgi:hypothetical protein
MKNLLKDPAFPDLVEQWAREERTPAARASANDNRGDSSAWLGDPFLARLAKLEIAATRCW